LLHEIAETILGVHQVSTGLLTSIFIWDSSDMKNRKKISLIYSYVCPASGEIVTVFRDETGEEIEMRDRFGFDLTELTFLFCALVGFFHLPFDLYNTINYLINL
jgi:hypothetical protein